MAIVAVDGRGWPCLKGKGTAPQG